VGRSGRVRRGAEAGAGVNATLQLDGRVWILISDPAEQHDDLLALDPATGRVTDRITLPLTGGDAIVPVGGSLWVTGQDGDVAVVRR
jgi:hypothetical protein